MFLTGSHIMATMNISLPDPLRDWVQEQIQDGNYSSSSDYVRDLIRRDRELREQKTVFQEAITAGLKSGISQRSMEDLLEEAKAKLAALNAN
jgi:antitoxin ParD1/3/4